MPRDEAKIQFSANVEEARQLWAAMGKGPEELERKITMSMARGRQGSDSLGGALAANLGQFLSIGSAITAMTQALNEFIAAKDRLRQLEDAAGLSVDESLRRFLLQANIAPGSAQAISAGQIIGGEAQRAATSFAQAESAATQLVSSGLSPQEALQGGGLGSILDLVNATGGRTPGDVAAQSLLQFIAGSGQELTGANIRRSGVAAQRLFKDTNLQLGDLPTLAAEASALTRAGISPEDQLILFARMREVLSAGPAATSLRNFATTLQGAGGMPKKKQALAALGLAPTDVDFVGETIDQVIATMRGGLAGVEPETGNIALTKLFGKENLASAGLILDPATDAFLAGRRPIVGDEAGFRSDVATTTTGRAAAQRRSETAIESSRAAAAEASGIVDEETILNRLELLGRETGMSASRIERMKNSYRGKLGTGLFGVDDYLTRVINMPLGDSPEDRVERALPLHLRGATGDIVSPAPFRVEVILRDDAGIEIPYESPAGQLGKPIGRP